MCQVVQFLAGKPCWIPRTSLVAKFGQKPQASCHFVDPAPELRVRVARPSVLWWFYSEGNMCQAVRFLAVGLAGDISIYRV